MEWSYKHDHLLNNSIFNGFPSLLWDWPNFRPFIFLKQLAMEYFLDSSWKSKVK